MRPTKALATSLGLALLIGAGATAATLTSPFLGTDLEVMVRDMARGIRDNYVFPDKGEEAAKMLETNLEQGDYNGLDDMQLAQRLTQDLRELTKDRHFGVRPAPLASERAQARPIALPPSGTMGFERIERLEGNIGYVDLRAFAPREVAEPTVHAAMRLLQGSDALIFDLRRNGGGDPETVQAVCSYLFDDSEPVHLNSLYFRPTDETTEFWTQPDTLESDAMGDTPIWVLTSGYTFSGGEEFAYNLKTRDRATLVGETTGGGAHPVDGFLLEGGSHMVMIPVGRAINPITGTNWEGTGVSPHVEAPADEALDIAIDQALTGMAESDEPGKAEQAAWALTSLRAKRGGQAISEGAMLEIAGDYGERQVELRDGALWYSRGTANAFSGQRKLVCVDDNTFVIDGVSDFKLVFNRERDGRVSGVTGHYRQRGPDYNAREN